MALAAASNRFTYAPQPNYSERFCICLSGCAVIPEIKHEPQVHNPFPQLHRVAILPFYNLSAEPTVNQDDVALAYYNELQAIPGFEVMPPGVVKQWLLANRIEIDGATDFQLLGTAVRRGRGGPRSRDGVLSLLSTPGGTCRRLVCRQSIISPDSRRIRAPLGHPAGRKHSRRAAV